MRTKYFVYKIPILSNGAVHLKDIELYGHSRYLKPNVAREFA